MRRWLYLQLLWAHPAGFRCHFADEMLEAFDYARSPAEQSRLLADAFLSLARQWFLRPEFHQPWQPAAAGPPSCELSMFQQIEPYQPTRSALAQGAVAALALLFAVGIAIQHGGGAPVWVRIGMHRPALGLIHFTRESVDGAPLDTTVEGSVIPDPWRPFALSYFHAVPILAALDRDGDLVLSPAEIAAAPAALRTLDRNHDGKLSAEECGFVSGGDYTRRAFMFSNPVLAALDADGDGVISAREIAAAPAELRTLDLDRDGRVTAYELLPNQAIARAAALMNRFDINDSGVISVTPARNEPDHASIHELLAPPTATTTAS